MKLPRARAWFWLALAALAGAGYAIVFVISARASNGFNSFPLDDSWIHLTYARNLTQHHAFTYFPGERSSAGSTSPLYTLLLAVGFLFTRDEKTLSYALGLLFHFLFLVTFAAWARRRLGGTAWAAVAVLLVAFDSRIAILSVSGMETSLLLFLIALAFHARLAGRAWLAGATLGLTVWVRPDGFILALVFALDALLDRIVVSRAEVVVSSPATARSRPAGKRGRAARPPATPVAVPARAAPGAGRSSRGHELWLVLLPAVVLVLGYFAFNLAVGGTLLPNTFAAKTAYYRVFSRLAFLRSDLVRCFAAGGWLVLAPFFLGALVREAYRLAARRPGALRAEAGWAVGLVLAYLVLLPFPHRFFRYLIPALPAVALLGLAGLRDLSARLAPARSFRWGSLGGAAAGFVLLAAGWFAGRIAVQGAMEYRNICRYHYERQERTGRWLAEHTPPSAVIATHDVGAIAYYSERKVVDIVGIVQPEAVVHLHRPDYTSYLADLFTRARVTHLAVLRNWLEVTNVAPLFEAVAEPEFMEVFRWVPGVTHLVPDEASLLNIRADQQLRAGNVPAAGSLLQQSLAVDSLSARTWFLLGLAREQAQRWDEAERAYSRAAALFPAYGDALARHAVTLTQLGRREEARAVLKRLLVDEPGYPGAQELYRRLER
jgi:tetratricopeptide (TPR) repeat protein